MRKTYDQVPAARMKALAETVCEYAVHAMGMPTFIARPTEGSVSAYASGSLVDALT